MKKNKLLTIMLITLLAITLVGIIFVVIMLNTGGKETEGDKEPSIDEILEASVEVPEVTTNLADEGFIKIKFTIQTDGKKGKEELEKRMFQVNNIIISELSELKAEQLQGKQGKENLQEKLETRINSILQEGTAEKVYITSAIIQ